MTFSVQELTSSSSSGIVTDHNVSDLSAIMADFPDLSCTDRRWDLTKLFLVKYIKGTDYLILCDTFKGYITDSQCGNQLCPSRNDGNNHFFIFKFIQVTYRFDLKGVSG